MAHAGRQNADSRLVIALASGLTVQEAATSAGVSVRTAHRRLQDKHFRATVDEHRARMLSEATGKLSALLSQAIDTLADLLASDTPATVRHSACRTALEMSMRLTEQTDIVTRMAKIEEAIENARNL